MYRYQLGLDAQVHDDFVSNHPQVNLLQSSKWALIKDNWKNERIGFYKNDELVAVASVLIQPLPLGFSMIYIPRGPVMDYNDEELVTFVIASLKSFAKTQRAIFTKLDPNIHLKSFNLENQDTPDKEDGLSTINLLTSLGCKWTGRTTEISNNVQPRFQANVYSENFSLDTLPKKTKQKIRTAVNKGVSITYGGIELVPIFSKLIALTEDRKNINLRNADYYQKLLTTYSNNSFITLAYLDLKTKATDLNQEFIKLEEESKTFTENTRKNKVSANISNKERVSKELTLVNNLLNDGLIELPLAGTLTINYGQTSENIYAGMDDNYRQFQAATLAWFETARHAFEQGCTSQNLGGIEGNLNGGLTTFKSYFNPIIEEFIGEFDIPTNKLLYRIVKPLYDLRKRIRNN